MPTTPINVGLIGCGTYGRETQLPTILADNNLKLVALANRSAGNLELATDVARQAGCDVNTYCDFHQLIADPDVHAVISTVPPSQNLAIVKACEKQGKPVLLEKPIAGNDDELQKIETIVEREKIHVQIGMQLLFSDWFTAFAEQVRQAGQLLTLNSQVYLFDNWAFEPMTWKVDAELSGGMLNSWGGHPLTMLLDLVAGRKADYADLTAFAGCAFAREDADPAMYDTLNATWLTTGGETDIPCQLQIALHPDVKQFTWRLEAVCAEAKIVGDFFTREITVQKRGEDAVAITVPPHDGPGFDGNRQQLQHFADCIRNNKKDDRTYQLAVTACLMALEININPTIDDA